MAKKTIHDQHVGRLIGYARVSTIDQNPQMQRDALARYGVKKCNFFEEKVSAAAKRRPKLREAIEKLREGDTLVVWRFDRIARSITNLLEIVKEIEEIGATFVSLTENVDLSTASGRLYFHMAAAFAEFERAIIRERTSAGMAAARAQGKTFGRKQKMTPALQDKAERLLLKGEKTTAVAEAVGLEAGLIYRYFYIETGEDGHVYVTRKIQAK